MTNLTKEEIIEELKKGICNVVFTKKNGDERDMRCTLSEDYLPKPKENTTKKTQSKTDSISVYDVNAKGFRSFNISNVITFESFS